jgi:hypothetical protein
MYELIRTRAVTSVRVGRLRRVRYGDLVAYASSLTADNALAFSDAA